MASFNSRWCYLSRCREDFSPAGCFIIHRTLKVFGFYTINWKKKKKNPTRCFDQRSSCLERDRLMPRFNFHRPGLINPTSFFCIWDLFCCACVKYRINSRGFFKMQNGEWECFSHRKEASCGWVGMKSGLQTATIYSLL